MTCYSLRNTRSNNRFLLLTTVRPRLPVRFAAFAAVDLRGPRGFKKTVKGGTHALDGATRNAWRMSQLTARRKLYAPLRRQRRRPDPGLHELSLRKEGGTHALD